MKTRNAFIRYLSKPSVTGGTVADLGNRLLWQQEGAGSRRCTSTEYRNRSNPSFYSFRKLMPSGSPPSPSPSSSCILLMGDFWQSNSEQADPLRAVLVFSEFPQNFERPRSRLHQRAKTSMRKSPSLTWCIDFFGFRRKQRSWWPTSPITAPTLGLFPNSSTGDDGVWRRKIHDLTLPI